MNETLGTVSEMIQTVIGEDWSLDGPITMETSFSKDLQLESIEFVALAERLQDRFGDHVDFAQWLASKELDEIIGLTVGDVVTFIDRSRADGHL